MKRSVPHNQVSDSPKILTRSNNKHTLANRLFDTPAQRANSQRRPRIFSNDANQSKLTPTIVKEYQTRKQTQPEQLPPIDSNPKKTRIMT